MRRWPTLFKRRKPAPFHALSASPITDAGALDVTHCNLKPCEGYRHRATDIDGNLIWPEDPDEAPAWWFERQALALTLGLPNPPYRTRREMESAINAIEMAERGFEPMGLAGPFSTEEAASRFLAYLQGHNVRQEYSAAELTDVYTEYCSTQNIVASPVDFVKAALALLPAVSKKKVERKGADGKRTRPVCWIIEPRLASIESPRTAKTDLRPNDGGEAIRMAA